MVRKCNVCFINFYLFEENREHILYPAKFNICTTVETG